VVLAAVILFSNRPDPMIFLLVLLVGNLASIFLSILYPVLMESSSRKEHIAK
jgi:hypothetical protein